ncbi:MAG TPA: hypothetical protein VLF18_07015 [Tahibacter sp.]|uniref:hypothetical protein n=1 Tax=Tahibacter sp. TaxID=2056211 RepID=UPI002C4DF74E|nr:hypothetical protein [Tahibacter sp.]HSX59932.1 hypothetical protein [Tahibacter sp.]
MTRWLIAVMIYLVALGANAATLVGGPTRGLWWNPAESGRGFNIEMQDDIMIVTSFVYAPNGSATWFISAGRYDFATNTFNATFDANTGGQCIGCAYVRPQGIANAAGPVRIVFDSYVTATLYYQGGSTRITKQLYAYDSVLSILRGSFVLTFNTSGLVIGDWLVMRTYESGSSGPFVAGYFDGFPTSRIAVALYDASTRRYAFLVRVGGYYDFYIVDMDDQRVFGLGWTYPVGGSPSGNGSAALGTRVQSPKEVNAEYARALLQDAGDADGDALRAAAYAHSKREGPGDAQAAALARQLEAALGATR